MSGIYIHIPFCKKKCTYCDFYTVVSPKFIPDIVKSIVAEIKLRSDYLENAAIETIYFGGGTPSILSKDQFSEIFSAIFATFSVNEDAEITFEANPDDLSPEFLNSIQSLPFNRISIGIQSFDDNDLKGVNRRHTGEQAIKAVRDAQNAGFNNISIDLIYGLPSQSLENWEKQLDTGLSLNVQHISAYGLTYEEGTRLWKLREKKLVTTVDDETMNEMYLLLVNKLKEKGFEAYEISNFALKNFRSRHNSAYWKQKPFLGIGPSAHSYNLHSRQWNVSSISEYINAIDNNLSFYEVEELTNFNKYNDYIMVSLRTSEGIDIKLVEKEFGVDLAEYCITNCESFIQGGKIKSTGGMLTFTSDGVLISNQILVQLMKV